MTTVRTRTDYMHRYHVHVDQDASTINCFMVELPPYTAEPGLPVVQRADMSMEETWREALTTLEFLRQQPYEPLYPPNVFIPFGVITARNLDDVSREHAIKLNMMIGECSDAERERLAQFPELAPHAHETRVAALIKALDLLDGAPLHTGPIIELWGTG